MTSRPIIIGTRGSRLALWQAELVQSELEAKCGVEAVIEIIKTQGDRVRDLPLDKLEGKGFFTKEIEDALLSGAVDIAVHSLKDLPTVQPDGLTIGAVGYRGDSREVLLVKPDSYDGYSSPLQVKSGARIGTSAARRKAQIAHLRTDLEIVDLRGNVPTRVNKLREGQYDAILIAAAGLERLQLDTTDLKTIPLDPELFLPAPAQGILGIELRCSNERTFEAITPLDSESDRLAVALERGLLARFDAGCSLPLGVLSDATGSQLRLKAVLGEISRPATGALKRAEATGAEPDKVVGEVYRQLTCTN